MFRWIAFTLVLSASGVAAVWMLAPHINSASATQPAAPPEAAPKKKQVAEDNEPVPVPRASSQRTRTSGPPEVFVYKNTNSAGLAEPVLIADCPLDIVEKQEVASEKEGVVKFIGTDVAMGENVPEELQLPPAKLGFLAILVGDHRVDAEDFQLPNDPRWYRKARPSESPDPTKGFLFTVTQQVRKLRVGDRVKRGQLLALINPAKASDDVSVKIAKMDAVEFKRQSAHNQKEEYQRRYRNYLDTNQRQPGAIPMDQLMETRLQMVKAKSEEEVEQAEIVEAQRTLNAAVTDLKMHEVRAEIDGFIMEIYKNSRGDAVKPYESLMRVENPTRLRVKGRLEIQEALKLKEGMTAYVEATRPEAPHFVLNGHLMPVNCVAVSKGQHPIIVSGSDDETLRGWDPISGNKLWVLWPLRSSVRAVACTPPTSERNLACFGCADGTVRVLDLDKPEELKPREMSERHLRPVLGVTFSPDGKVIATCSDDKSVRLWKTETGELMHTLYRHSAPVTSVQFASAKRLVSAGKDRQLIVWDVEDMNRPHAINSPRFDNRGAQVSTLGVSPDSKTVLFDQGKEIRLLSMEDKNMVGFLQNPTGGMNFSTMALFSPDGKTILTSRSGSAHESLQLWRTPMTQPRGSELRQFVWKGEATCGAFAPEDSTFAVTGTKDHKVLVWAMPSKEEIDSRLEAKLTLVEKYLDAQNRDVRVWAELDSPEWLFPGMRATMVVKPQQGK